MIKLKDVVEKYGDYEVNEEQLEKVLVKPTPKTIWDLNIGDLYFGIHKGYVFKFIWEGSAEDHNRRDAGDVFLTQEEAEFELERRKIETELLKLGGTRDFWSFRGNDIEKYHLAFDPDDKELYVDFNYISYQGSIYFRTEKEIKKAIKEIGEDRIKKYLFYVKDTEDKEND